MNFAREFSSSSRRLLFRVFDEMKAKKFLIEVRSFLQHTHATHARRLRILLRILRIRTIRVEERIHCPKREEEGGEVVEEEEEEEEEPNLVRAVVVVLEGSGFLWETSLVVN